MSLRWDIWQRDVSDAGWGTRTAVTAARLAAVVWAGFGRHQLTMRASALTYITILSLVPTLAVAFAMFTAFGGLENAEALLLPRIMDTLAVGVRDEAQAKMRELLGNIHGGALGATGLLFLGIAAVMLLESIEDALNDIWGVRPTRTRFQRVTTYWAVLTVTPTLLAVGLSLPAVLEAVLPLQASLDRVGALRAVVDWLVPLGLVVAAFTLLYLFMTEARVRVSAAVAGGVVAGTVWSTAAWAYAWYARTTVYYADVYGSLSAIPIFLFWLWLAWLIVLTGALVAFAWQNLATYRQELLAPQATARACELLALRIVVEAARGFLGPGTPPQAAELPARLHVSGRLLNGIVARLVTLGWLLPLGEHGAVVPARDPRQLSPAALLQAWRGQGAPAVWEESDEATHALEARYDAGAEGEARVWREVSVADLATAADAASPPDGRHRARPRGHAAPAAPH